MSQLLQYNYVSINLESGEVTGCVTVTYVVDHPQWIEVPVATSDYVGKYYNVNGDHLFYWDTEFTDLWEECPSHNV